MNVTTKAMRENVKGWLEQERATRGQSLQLLDAIYAGAIQGDVYEGRRDDDESPELTQVFKQVKASGTAARPYSRVSEWECGCLLDTLERIKGDRPAKPIKVDATGYTFAFAMKIGIGDTPDSNPWSKAAAQGVEDYYAERGWK